MPPESLLLDLDERRDGVTRVALSSHALLLRGFASDRAVSLVTAIRTIAEAAPFRQMVTPGGWQMSVAVTSCGVAGWVSDRRGYRYDRLDPESGKPWPAMPDAFRLLAAEAASIAGYPDFSPDACLINRYVPGSRMSLHQDRNELDFDQPIVSLSLGLPAIFLWGGALRTDRARRIGVSHADVVVWGGPDRLRFHGIHPLARGVHPVTGALRYNITFRKAL
jgi:DNA oxidative demethylase